MVQPTISSILKCLPSTAQQSVRHRQLISTGPGLRSTVCRWLQALALPTLLGLLSGYLTYDCLHYAMHHGIGRRLPLLRQARPRTSHRQSQRARSNRTLSVAPLTLPA